MKIYMKYYEVYVPILALVSIFSWCLSPGVLELIECGFSSYPGLFLLESMVVGKRKLTKAVRTG